MTVQVIRSNDGDRKPEISVVIPTLNRADMLAEALSALQGQSFSDFEVLVVDNGPSEDDTRQRVLDLMLLDKRLVYLSIAEKNLEAARNAGTRHARADVVLLTDDDWEMTDPHTLEYIVQSFKEDVSLGVLGISHDYAAFSHMLSNTRDWRLLLRKYAAMLFYRPGTISRWGRISTRFHYLPFGSKVRVDHVRGCCLAFRATAARDVGLFPTVYVFQGLAYRSETEFCCRIARKGYKILFSSEVTGVHKAAARPYRTVQRARSPEKMRLLAKNHMLFMLRNYWSPITSPLFLLVDVIVGNRSQPGLVNLLMSRQYFARISLVLASFRGKWDGFMEYHRRLSEEESANCTDLCT